MKTFKQYLLEEKGLTFLRVGGLGQVKYKKLDDYGMSGATAPPEKRGIYAFPFPYFDRFFVANTDKKKRKFTYDGPLWTHLTHKNMTQSKGSWNLMDMNSFKDALKKAKHADSRVDIKDPYVRGLGGYISIDHLEVFIPGKHTNRIK